MKHTWSIGERIFKKDYRRRIKMFDSLVVSVMAYGVELWGWEEVEEMERVQKKYLKWTLGLERCTPDCILFEETKREKLRLRFAKLAADYESEVMKKGGIVKECLMERIKGKGCKNSLKCRMKLLNECGLSQKEVEAIRNDEFT
ncbi:uncharacterized protein LOC123262505 [Cotesia glomerata]|uniref:uncharacterized protein LOC123262505 n=1 Tax=Cotesia glomerata TaxID=32391 RepID=UPI001D02D177|nr:uncharacterized protein LOC123262505 [Cotesia glomerata]